MVKKVSYDNAFKAKVALDAIRGDKTVAEIVPLADESRKPVK